MSKHLWICLTHKTEIKNREELNEHIYKNQSCVISGDLEDE